MAIARRELKRPLDPPFSAAPRKAQVLPRAKPAVAPAAQLNPLKRRAATALPVAPSSRYKPTQTVGQPAAASFGLSREISSLQEAKRQRAATSKTLSVVEELRQQGKAFTYNKAKAEGASDLNRLCMAEEEAVFVEPLPGPNSGIVRMKLSNLGKEVTGSKKARQLLLKRKRALRRQSRNTWKLRATTGGTTVLETLSASTGTLLDYERRLNSFWAFADLFKLPLERDREFDLCAADWSDLEFLSGEGPEVGTKLLTALERWALTARERGILELPRFRKVLRSWRKNSPMRSRLPMPEAYLWIICGILGFAEHNEEALFLAALFETMTRPTELLYLMCHDVLPPSSGSGYKHVTLLLAPFEREQATKTGFYDETVMFDGTLVKDLGDLVYEHALRRQPQLADAKSDEEAVPLWSFPARSLLSAFKGAVRIGKLEDMDTLYQARHGGASRAKLLRLMTDDEIQMKLRHATSSSFRIYAKPGRLQQAVTKLSPQMLEYAGKVRDSFSSCVRSGKWPAPPGLPQGLQLI